MAKQMQKLSDRLAKRNIRDETWLTLRNSCYPTATQDELLMLIDYCQARNLDPIKKPVHIVPLQTKQTNPNTGRDEYVTKNVIMPGIYELRVTAHRTGQFVGMTDPEFGEPITIGSTTVPSSCTVRAKRAFTINGQLHIGEFPGRVLFHEVAGFKKEWDDVQRKKVPKGLNKMWAERPVTMLIKCAEAAALRSAFPEEIGNEQVVEEVDIDDAGQPIPANDKSKRRGALADDVIEGESEELPEPEAPDPILRDRQASLEALTQRARPVPPAPEPETNQVDDLADVPDYVVTPPAEPDPKNPKPPIPEQDDIPF